MRLTGPGLSLGASGTIGKTVVFSIWKGQAYGRIRVIPKNFRTDAQQTVRSVLGTISKAARAVLTKFKDTAVPAVGSQFFLDGNSFAPSGQSWLSWMQQVTYSVFAGLVTTFAGLGSVAALYETEAGDMGMASYTDKMGVTHSPGEQLYVLASFATSSLGYTGFAGGIDSATAPQLVSFATYVQTTV